MNDQVTIGLLAPTTTDVGNHRSLDGIPICNDRARDGNFELANVAVATEPEFRSRRRRR